MVKLFIYNNSSDYFFMGTWYCFKISLYENANSIYKNRNMNKLEKLTNKIVKKEFDKRIRILRTRKFINLKNKFKITIKGLKLIKIVTKLRKAFNISLINFYFGNALK